MVGNHTLKATSTLQSSVGLNVSECEYYALVHGAAHGLGLQAYYEDLGISIGLNVLSDSSSARALGSRRGLGKQRHVQTRFLWLQERIALEHLKVTKVGTAHNPSDILTKPCGRETLERHMKRMNAIRVRPHASHKEVVAEGGE